MKKRVLMSVSDKTGIIDFAKGLAELGYEIISTGGTKKVLDEAGIKTIAISGITGFPECLDGRVKTLHPNIHAGILAMRENPDHMSQLAKLNINTIDVVVVNLYPFKATISKPNVKLEDAVENIDIGGPAMIRAAAKNYQDVLVVVDPNDYNEILVRIKKGETDRNFRLGLMYKTFTHTAVYDSMISEYMRSLLNIKNPDKISLAFEKVQDCRYGENSHQSAAFYSDAIASKGSLANAQQLSGKELSFNNINDTHGAIMCLQEFDEPTVVAVKHSTPCGVCSDPDLLKAYIGAYDCDPISIFGGIVAVNRKIEKKLAEKMVEIFLEVVIAPDYDKDALEVFITKKPNIRVLKLEDISTKTPFIDIKKVSGGLLLQDGDTELFNKTDLKIVTEKNVSKEDMKQLEFATKIVKHLKSNGIAIVKDGVTLGVDGGQTNRIDACIRAIQRAGEKVKGAYLASEAFFPLPDCVEAAAAAGIKAIVQPGGSIKDKDSIDACNRHGIAMVLTGMRHFRH